MKLFVNREKELKKLKNSKAKLIVLFGRRRVGKTTLIEKWGKEKKIAYTQAIEGSELVQIEQIMMDLQSVLPSGIKVRTWNELLSLIKLVKVPNILVFDEFPYLVRGNASLPSILQKWTDHEQPDKLQVVLLGSSQSMMHSLFLSSDSPLFERADLILKIEPMTYRNYCEATSCNPLEMNNFLKYSMVGGVPRYWRYIEDIKDPLDVADHLFFEKSARLEDEPDRLLKDEEIIGQQAKAIFESIGRGASKPSEIAARMGIPQTALSKPLGILMHSNLIRRVIPFGENSKNVKKTLYQIEDYALRFWYRVYSPHRSRWHLYDSEAKIKLIRDHASKVLEDEFRKLYLEASEYWEGSSLEFDSVRFSRKNLKNIIITELKMSQISKQEKNIFENQLKQKFENSQLRKKFDLEKVEVLGGAEVLKYLVETVDRHP